MSATRRSRPQGLQPTPKPRSSRWRHAGRAALQNIVEQHRVVLLVTALSTLVALVLAFLATPIYTVDALIQLELPGLDTPSISSSATRSSELRPMLVAREIEVLRSRTNIEQALRTARLCGETRVANRLPVVGEWLARNLRRDADGLAIPPALPLVRTADWSWGGERIEFTNLVMPRMAYNRQHDLLIGAEGTWVLYGVDGTAVLEGKIGARSENPATGYELEIAELVAHPGTRFAMTRQSTTGRVAAVRRRLRVSETQSNSGVIRVEYTGSDRYASARLVNSLVDSYLQHSAARRAEQAARSRPLPSDLQQPTAAHAGSTARAAVLPGAIVIDPAVAPDRASGPSSTGMVLTWILGGLAGGLVLAQPVGLWRRRVRDPRVLETAVGAHIAAAIPLSPEQLHSDRRGLGRSPYLLAQARPGAPTIAALRGLGADLQGDRVSTGIDTGIVIMLTSAISGQGSTFVAANLAWVVAAAGQRVLLIDADLGCASLRRYLPATGGPGLSDIVRERLDPDAFVKTGIAPNLAVLPAGAHTDETAIQRGAEHLANVMAWARRNYEIVIIDAPPVLHGSMAIGLGCLADATGLVVRHETARFAEVIRAIDQYRAAGADVTGLVVNGFRSSPCRDTFASSAPRHSEQYGFATGQH